MPDEKKEPDVKSAEKKKADAAKAVEKAEAAAIKANKELAEARKDYDDAVNALNVVSPPPSQGEEIRRYLDSQQKEREERGKRRAKLLEAGVDMSLIKDLDINKRPRKAAVEPPVSPPAE